MVHAYVCCAMIAYFLDKIEFDWTLQTRVRIHLKKTIICVIDLVPVNSTIADSML